MGQPTGVELFFSYSHRDQELRDELERHLSLLKRRGVISTWHDRRIGAGSEWAGEIDEHLERASLILLLISADFLSSDYCYDVELRMAMERHVAGTARVIPVVLRSVDWTGAPFSNLQAVPTDGKPVTSWTNRDEAFTEVTRAIREAATQLLDSQGGPSAARHEASSCYPVAQRRVIEEKSRAFVGRQEVFRRFDRFMATHQSGYFIVESAPGFGKSAVAAKLVRDRQAVHHFIGVTEGRSDPHLILGSMIEQVSRRPPLVRPDVRPLAELRETLVGALQERVAAEGSVVVVVDALNESPPAANDFAFLPTVDLPAGAYWFVTTQPGERIDRWKGALSPVTSETFALGPLHDDDIRQMIGQLASGIDQRTATTIVNTAQGSPLYVEAAVHSLARDPELDLARLPGSIGEYFRRATQAIARDELLLNVLGLLAVSRTALSLHDLSELLGIPQRRVHEDVIQRVRPFLRQSGLRFELYHQQFHEFVVTELMFGDELRRCHRLVSDWLDRPAAAALSYRWTSFAHHLFNAQEPARLLSRIDAGFLQAKCERFGYAVLEDVELIARSQFERGDASVVEQCVSLVESLRSIGGDELLADLAGSVRPNRATSYRSAEIAISQRGTVPGVDVHAALLPKGRVSADFVEIAQADDTRLVVAIGDAPSSGLKSAFVARFIATAFSRSVTTRATGVGRMLSDLNRLLSANDYFERVSMQCVEVAPGDGVISMAAAGHPYPVLYSRRRRACDILPVRGPLLHDIRPDIPQRVEYEERHAEVEPGDLLVLVTDGLTEGGRLDGDAYGYRFTRVVEQSPEKDAQSVCEAILDDWRRHPRTADTLDDVAVVVVSVGAKHAG